MDLREDELELEEFWLLLELICKSSDAADSSSRVQVGEMRGERDSEGRLEIDP